VITLPGAPVNYTENAAAPVLDAQATVVDADSLNLDGGVLTVDYSANAHPNDRLAIRHQGLGPQEIGITGGSVMYGGTVIGTFSGGVGTTPLALTFNASSSPFSAQRQWCVT
jgi:hypothetical protein